LENLEGVIIAMNSRILLAAAAVVAALPTSHFVHAAPTTLHAPVNAMFAKEKTVKLSLRNGGTSSIELKVGDNLMTLAAGQVVKVDLPIGTRIVTNTTTSNAPAGTLITQVSPELSGAVLTVK
jgi:hypothetical protein